MGTRTHAGTCGDLRGNGMVPARLDVVGMQLNQAERFVDAATMVCDESRHLGVPTTAVALHFARGPVALCVDNSVAANDEQRMAFMSQHTWDHHAIFRLLREHGGLRGAEADPLTFASPVIGPTGWFATIIHRHVQPAAIVLERELAMLSTQLSVWCTERGVSAVPDSQIDALTTRQYRIAELAARGLTNYDIADELGISVNTVKVRLKQIFIRVNAANRTELANVLRRLAPLQDVPVGISRRATVSITRVVKTPAPTVRRRRTDDAADSST